IARRAGSLAAGGAGAGIGGSSGVARSAFGLTEGKGRAPSKNRSRHATNFRRAHPWARGGRGPRRAREGGLPWQVVQRRLEEHQDLGDGVERERLERGGERAELIDSGRAAGGDGGERGGGGRSSVTSVLAWA